MEYMKNYIICTCVLGSQINLILLKCFYFCSQNVDIILRWHLHYQCYSLFSSLLAMSIPICNGGKSTPRSSCSVSYAPSRWWSIIYVFDVELQAHIFQVTAPNDNRMDQCVHILLSIIWYSYLYVSLICKASFVVLCFVTSFQDKHLALS